ncbi:MAG: RnfH family protein [Methylococcales bacterium]|nr:RnfH family protein [Methylococcales bacterium]
MVKQLIDVEVAFAMPKEQLIVSIKLEQGVDVKQAINESALAEHFSEIDLDKMAVGIFGKQCKLDQVLEQGDRVEIYRPLLINPMDARRNRAIKR